MLFLLGIEIGVQYGNVAPGKSVAIVGAGPVGMGALLTAQLYSPAHLIVIDFDKNRLEMAKKARRNTHISAWWNIIN
nr:hypothetical protein [Mycoplasmopsis bovis]